MAEEELTREVLQLRALALRNFCFLTLLMGTAAYALAVFTSSELPEESYHTMKYLLPAAMLFFGATCAWLHRKVERFHNSSETPRDVEFMKSVGEADMFISMGIHRIWKA